MSVHIAPSTLKVRGLYACRDCGHKQFGDAVDVSVSGTAQDVADDLANHKPRAGAMPMGWSSYYSREGTIYSCSDCNR